MPELPKINNLPRQPPTKAATEPKGVFGTLANLPDTLRPSSHLDGTDESPRPDPFQTGIANHLDPNSHGVGLPVASSLPHNGENSEILVPGLSSLTTGIRDVLQKLEAARWEATQSAPYTVDTDTGTTPGDDGRSPHGKRTIVHADATASSTRTTVSYGLTGNEVKRLVNGTAFMLTQRRQMWFATVGDRLFDDIASGKARDIIADVEKRIGKLQKELSLPTYRLTVYEGIGGLHAHMLFIGRQKMVEQLIQSPTFEPYLDIRWAYDVPGLSEAYLCKERTSQADYGLGNRLKGGRRKGSHRLPGGGDRVRLSGALKRDAIAAGYVEPWKPTNAKRAETRKRYRLRRIVSWKASRPVGQLPLFPEVEKAPTRLRDFHSGRMPASVAIEFEFQRRQRGWSQRKLGELAGLSQPTLANAVSGLYGLSRDAVVRIKQVIFDTSDRPST